MLGYLSLYFSEEHGYKEKTRGLFYWHKIGYIIVSAFHLSYIYSFSTSQYKYCQSMLIKLQLTKTWQISKFTKSANLSSFQNWQIVKLGFEHTCMETLDFSTANHNSAMTDRNWQK